MKIFTQRGFGNILLRRVRRHSTFATLFSTAAPSLVHQRLENASAPTLPPGKAIVQATLADRDLVNRVANLPIKSTEQAYLPGAAIPIAPSRPQPAPAPDLVKRTGWRQSRPGSVTGRQEGISSENKPEVNKQSIWHRLVDAVRPKQEAANSTVAGKPQTPVLPEAAAPRSSALQTQPAETASPPIHTQLPQAIPGSHKSGDPTPVASPEKSGLSVDDWKVLQSIHRKHQEKADRISTEALIHPSPLQESTEIPDDLPGKPATASLHPDRTPSLQARHEEKTSPASQNIETKLVNPVFNQMRNLLRNKKVQTRQSTKTSSIQRSEIKDISHSLAPAQVPSAESDNPQTLSGVIKDLRTDLAGGKDTSITPSSIQLDRSDMTEISQAKPPTHIGQSLAKEPSSEKQKPPLKAAPVASKTATNLRGEISGAGKIQPPEPGLTTQQRDNTSTQENSPDQTLPLEKIWPVETLQNPELVASGLPAEADLQRSSLFKPAGTADREIQRKLEMVSTGEPTGSSVEVITPRRPRPVQMAQEPPLPFQKKPAPGEMIHTDIGELPADLWHLIGESPPNQDQHQSVKENISAPSQFEPTPSSPDKAGLLQRSSDEKLPSATPEKNSSRDFSTGTLGRKKNLIVQPALGTDTLQREVNRAEGDTSTPKPAVTVKGIQGVDEDINIEALSSQVYREVKRRLSIEWERTRRY